MYGPDQSFGSPIYQILHKLKHKKTMASLDQYELGTATRWINRIRARLSAAMIAIRSEEIFKGTAYSINRIAEANSVLNDIDNHVRRYALAVALDPSIEAAYMAARDASGGAVTQADIELGIDAIADANIDSEISSLINAFANVNAFDVLDSRKPQNLEVKDITGSSVNIIWDRVPSHDSYKQRWRQKGTSTWTNGTSAQNFEIKDITALSAATTYEVQVSTVYSGGESNWSDILEFTTS